jgi:Flp pilus assembly pilin Flp
MNKVVGTWLVGLPASAANNGQNAVEYGLLLATIAVIVLMGTTAFGNLIKPWIEQLAGRIITVGS